MQQCCIMAHTSACLTPPERPKAVHVHPENNFWEKEIFYKSLQFFLQFHNYNSTIPLPSIRGFAHPLISAGVSHMNIQYFLAPQPSTKNYISCSENALKLNCSNVEFQNFPSVGPPDPHFKGKGEGGKGCEGRRGEGEKKRREGSGNRGKLCHGLWGEERPCFYIYIYYTYKNNDALTWQNYFYKQWSNVIHEMAPPTHLLKKCGAMMVL